LAFWGELLANIGQAAFLKPSKNLLGDLRNNSNTLKDISEDFRSIAENYAITSFYESEKLKVIGREVYLQVPMA
jgi:hypothetical protein